MHTVHFRADSLSSEPNSMINESANTDSSSCGYARTKLLHQSSRKEVESRLDTVPVLARHLSQPTFETETNLVNASQNQQNRKKLPGEQQYSTGDASMAGHLKSENASARKWYAASSQLHKPVSLAMKLRRNYMPGATKMCESDDTAQHIGPKSDEVYSLNSWMPKYSQVSADGLSPGTAPQSQRQIHSGASFISAGEATRMLKKVDSVSISSSLVDGRYIDIPPATLSHHDFAKEFLFDNQIPHHVYTQALIWCFTRRIDEVTKQGTTSKVMRIVQVLVAMRAKLGSQSMVPFATPIGWRGQKLKLKPTMLNPKNCRNSRKFNEFKAFSSQLKASMQEGIQILEEFENKIQSVNSVDAVDFCSCDFEMSRLETMHEQVEVIVQRLATQSIAIGDLAEDARELFREMQDRHSASGHKSLSKFLQNSGFC